MFKWWYEPTSYNAFILSTISLLVTVAAFVFGIVGFMSMQSSLLLCYAFENLVDLISSAIVLWRFYMPVGSMDSEALNALLEEREQRASVGISFVIIGLGFMIIVAAIEDFARGLEREERDEWLLYYVSFISMIVFGALGLIKFRFSKLLKSESLYKDGICSMVGTILSASLFCNTVIILSTGSGNWWLDPTVAIICGLASLVYGLNGIYYSYVVEGLPIFSRKWWRIKRSTPSKNNGTDVENRGPMPHERQTPVNVGDNLSSPYGTDVTNEIVVGDKPNIENITEPNANVASVPPMNAFTPETTEVPKIQSNHSNGDNDSITEIELT